MKYTQRLCSITPILPNGFIFVNLFLTHFYIFVYSVLKSHEIASSCAESVETMTEICIPSAWDKFHPAIHLMSMDICPFNRINYFFASDKTHYRKLKIFAVNVRQWQLSEVTTFRRHFSPRPVESVPSIRADFRVGDATMGVWGRHDSPAENPVDCPRLVVCVYF